MKKNLVIFNIWDAISNDYLCELLSITEDEKEYGYISDVFDCDPDFIKYEGAEVAYITCETETEIYFIYNSHFNVHIVDHSEDVDEFFGRIEMIEMIENFYLNDGGDFNYDYYDAPDWYCLDTGIKYRNGSGYTYGIYEYTKNNIIYNLSKEQLILIMNRLVLLEIYDGEYDLMKRDIKKYL